MAKPKKKPVRTQAAENSRRGAAAMAHATRGMARILTPNRKKHDRKEERSLTDGW